MKQDQWRGLPGVTNIPFGVVIGGGGYWPFLWWRRWGKKVFIVNVIISGGIGWAVMLRFAWEIATKAWW